MFTHALNLKVLVGVLLGNYRSRCNLHFAEDLFVLTTRGLKDLRIVKLLLLTFERITGLETNFSKTYLYSSNWGDLSVKKAVETLSC